MLYNRYEKEQKYINGTPAIPAEYRKGDYLGQYEFNNIKDCENIAIYRWIETGNSICVDYSLYKEEKKQVSYDDGQTWEDTDDRRGGTMIEEHSVGCGWRQLEGWQKVRDICKGYNLETEYELRRSEDMGNTWEGTGIFKYIVKEFVNYDCAMQAEPLTYQIELSSRRMVTFPLLSVDYTNVLELYDKSNIPEQYKCYIDWGLGGDIKEYTSQGGFENRFPAGTYTVKFWGLFDTINSPNCKHSLISWGEANNCAPARLVNFDLFITGDGDYNQPYPDNPSPNTMEKTTDGLNTPKTDRYYVTPTIIDLTNVHSIPQDNKGALKYIEKFSCSLLNESIPDGLFESCWRLRDVDFSNSLITSIPINLFHNCYLNTLFFDNCINLIAIPDIVTAGLAPRKYMGGLKYKEMGEPVMKCKKCLMEDQDVSAAMVACRDVHIRFRYIEDSNKGVPHCWTNVPPDINKFPANGLLYIPKGAIGFGRSLTAVGYQNLINLLKNAWIVDITLSDDWAISNQYFYDRFPSINNTREIQVPGVFAEPVCFWPQTDWMDFIHPEGGYIYRHPYKLTPKYRYARIYKYYVPSPFEWIYETEGGEKPSFAASFKNCKSLTTVNISSTPPISSISFEGCTALNSIQTLNTKEGVSVSFKGCTSLPDINLDVNWGHFNFQDTTSLENATIKCIDNCDMSSAFIGSGIKNCTIIGNPSNTSNMFKGTAVEVVNINTSSPIKKGDSMFEGITSDVRVGSVTFNSAECLFKNAHSLTSTGGVSIGSNAYQACYNCTGLTTVGAGFLGGLYNCNAEECFANCTSLESVPNELISDSLSYPDDSNINHLFYNCTSLTTWIKNDQDIWDWRRFLNDNKAYEGCSKILLEVPISWGGLLGTDFSVCIEYTLMFNSPFKVANYDAVLVDDTNWYGGHISLTPGEHNIKVYTKSTSYDFPYREKGIDDYVYVTSILQIGNLQDINNYSKCRYICSGDHLWKTKTNLNEIFKDCTELVDVADDIFKNCTNVNQMNYPFENCALPEDKVTTIMTYITNLTNADYILKNKNFTTTCGIVDNNPNLISMNYAFDNMPNLTTLPSNFPTSLTQMEGAFRYCASLTGEAPHLWERSDLQGIWAFGFTSLTGIDDTKWGGNYQLFCTVSGTDTCEFSMSLGEFIIDKGVNSTVHYVGETIIPIEKIYNLGEVPDRTVNFYKIGDTNIQDFEYRSPAENVEIYGTNIQ